MDQLNYKPHINQFHIEPPHLSLLAPRGQTHYSSSTVSTTNKEEIILQWGIGLAESKTFTVTLMIFS
ncbi:hypothetical protein XELAEV_18012967mg [Xenopus laevis]|uniref:Uncharacterized protein n=1 Tax=Xenopus laevis TaxID=8355 RepID=A0A974DPY2_XENLA|nr:hypothetical protein XELAEV_18012967mg [Xenopus laevis]